MCVYIYVYIFHKQCLHFAVLTYAVTGWPAVAHSQPWPGYSYGVMQTNNVIISLFRITDSKWSEYPKAKENICFSTSLANIVQNQQFYNDVLHCLSKHDDHWFSTFVGNMLQKHYFMMLFCMLDPKTNEYQWVFVIFA